MLLPLLPKVLVNRTKDDVHTGLIPCHTVLVHLHLPCWYSMRAVLNKIILSNVKKRKLMFFHCDYSLLRGLSIVKTSLITIIAEMQ